MRSTLFFIPHELGPLPLFGWGWVAIAILIAWAIVLWIRRSQSPHNPLLFSDATGWLVTLGIIIFFIPQVEERFPLPSNLSIDSVPGLVAATDTSPAMRIVGLPVRGYGIFLMLGFLAGVGLISKRGESIGIPFEQILSLAIYSIVGGMLGARSFFVIQKWSELKGDSFIEKMFEALKFTEGGLVVYGGLFGGLATAMAWCWIKKIPMLKIADLATPAFLIGLALGRLGCLMNGCCYGGICETGLPSITFPKASPPYVDQLVSGKLLGIEWARNGSNGVAKIANVTSQSWAEKNGLKVDDVVDSPEEFAITRPAPGLDPAGPNNLKLFWSLNGTPWSPKTDLPERSRPTHPSQIYASINAALLCGFLFWIWPNIRRPGTVLGLGLVGYGFSRILEEYIRVDEQGQFGTSFSISQWISVLGIVLGIAILAIPRKIQPNQPPSNPNLTPLKGIAGDSAVAIPTTTS